ncbi:MAG: hypothetical protein ABT940_12200 [Alphaproteobacteria bacterium]
MDVVRFTAGGFRFAMEARWVRSMRRADPSDASGTVSVETLLGPLSPDAATARRELTVDLGGRTISLSVGDPVTLDRIVPGQVFELPTLVAARTSLRGVRGLALDEQGVVLLVDMRTLASVVEDTGSG